MFFVQANWFIVLDAAVLTVGGGSGLSGYLYFFSVRLILGTLLLPVFFGFVIEAFNNNLPVVLTEQRARREAMLSELSELQNMSEDPQTFLYDTAREFDGVHAGERLPDTGTPLLSDVGPAGSQPLPLLSRVKSRLVDVGDGGNSDTRSDSRRSRASMSSGSGKQPPDWKEYVLKSKPKASDIQTALFVSSSSGFQLQAPPAAPSRSRSAVFGDVDKPLVSGEGEMARMAAALESERKGHEEAKQRIQTLEQELALLRQKKGRRG